jgi:hypothetical protein
MNATEWTSPNGSFAALRRIARAKRADERCDFCGAGLGGEHQHLIRLREGEAQRRLVCVCEPCAILFGNQGETHYRRVPRRALYLADFRMTDAQWEGLLIPIQLAFFFHTGPAGKVVALYPSPGGLTESLLDLATWEEIARDNPAIRRMTPEVEGLLVNRARRISDAPEYYLAPIDACFTLAGLIRTTWRGLSGGETVWKEIGQFFTDLKARANQVLQHGLQEEDGRIGQGGGGRRAGRFGEESHA